MFEIFTISNQQPSLHLRLFGSSKKAMPNVQAESNRLLSCAVPDLTPELFTSGMLTLHSTDLTPIQ